MELDDLHYFTASANAGNFSRAGQALGRNPSTLSRRIGRLENELGLPLFERRHGGVQLTSGGKAVLVHVRRALAEIELIKDAGLKHGAATILVTRRCCENGSSTGAGTRDADECLAGNFC